MQKTEEFRIITPTQFDRAAGECLDRVMETAEGHEDNHLVQLFIHFVQLFCIDLERTIFKEED